ncbi:MAG: citrate synthase [Candidatus Latescibacteria bacterium]|nr:citrate synthase [Candidatus Latescibacterota bacterium]
MADTITVIDNRTGKQYELPIKYGTYPTYGAAINTGDLRDIKVSDDDFGLMGYDPGFTNTASCQSAITFIDGEKGILKYRGYSIEELAEKSSFLEVAYLLVFGSLPTQSEMKDWTYNIIHHSFIHENIKKFMDGFRYDSHPMGVMVSTVAALSAFYPESKDIMDEQNRVHQVYRLIAKMPTIAALAYRHRMGYPYTLPDNELSYTGNFLSMMFKMTARTYVANPVLEKALDVLFILHADHEQNCSASAMRGVGSSQPDPYVSVAAAAAGLYGPSHGGANEQVLRMLREIGTKDRVPEYIQRVKDRKFRLMGFGHRVYKSYDPRATILREMTAQVLDITGKNELLEVAMELERIALEDEFFVDRKLYPNVDFYSGIIYQAMGFQEDMFTVLFAIPRTAGWLAQWIEMLNDEEFKIVRPRQIYTGEDVRGYAPIDARPK